MNSSAPKPYIGAFAPSPSGPLHFGSLIAALGSYLQAKSQQGTWLLRIEDLDPPREIPGAADDILFTLDAFGLHWDGPLVYQSQRWDAYQAILEQWASLGLTYYCHCSRKTIAENGGFYTGHCRALGLGPAQAATRLVMSNPVYDFVDQLQGVVKIPTALAEEDFIVRRRDGFYAYNLAVVLDDADAGITEVVRGADLLEPTGRQIALYQRLNAPIPNWLHLPLATVAGNKLSKQNHAPALDLSQASHLLCQALSFLGQAPPANLCREPVTEVLNWALAHWQLEQVPKTTYSVEMPRKFAFFNALRYYSARIFLAKGHARCPIFSQIAGFCKKLLTRTPQVKTEQEALPLQPVILTRDQHGISRQQISDNALKVLYRLNKAGFEAYLVGGGVRDLLLGRQPKDFDIATSATPEQVKQLFSNSRLVGRRFRLAHILFGRDVIEVATFRGHHHETNNNKNISSQSSEGMLLRDNVYGTIEEDAERRDFSVNALYYNIADFSVVGFSNGLKDLEARRLELIGDPETRYREDPVRMIRAVRFSAKLGLTISPRTAAPIRELAPLLGDIPAARLFEETLKLLLAGQGLETYRQLQQYGLFAPLFPEAADVIGQGDNDYHKFLELALTNTDERIAQDLRVTPAFLYAALLWGPVETRTQQFMHEGGLSYYDAFLLAMDEVLGRQVKSVAIPRRYSSVVRDIWMLQDRLTKRSGKRPHRLLEHPKFRAGYDFLLLRAELDPKLQELADWWTEFQLANPVDRQQLSRHAQARHNQFGGEESSKAPRKRPRRRPRKKKEE